MTTTTIVTGRIGRGTAVHAFVQSDRGAWDLCGSSFYRNARPQRKALTGQPLSDVTCQKCLKALADRS